MEMEEGKGPPAEKAALEGGKPRKHSPLQSSEKLQPWIPARLGPGKLISDF